MNRVRAPVTAAAPGRDRALVSLAFPLIEGAFGVLGLLPRCGRYILDTAGRSKYQ
jgi:hypothetical protein